MVLVFVVLMECYCTVAISVLLLLCQFVLILSRYINMVVGVISGSLYLSIALVMSFGPVWLEGDTFGSES